MSFFAVARDYLVWHYSVALSDILHIWLNYIWFVNHLFSVPDVLKTLFAPWKRLQEERVNILQDASAFFGNLFVNLIMRMVGLVVRLGLLAVALCCFGIVFIGGVMFFFLWLALPVLIAHFFISGIRLLIS